MRYKGFLISILLISGSLFIPCGVGDQYDQSFDRSDDSILEMFSNIDMPLLEDLMEGLLAFGPRHIHDPNCSKAARYIYDHFERFGLQVEYQDWVFPLYKGTNVVATLPGTNIESDAVFIISAHYDTAKDSPGAIDDGSGVVAMMAIAQVLSSYSFDHTIKFIAFSGEEVGAYGSYAYAKKAYETCENIKAVLNLDMIAYTLYNGSSVYVSFGDRSLWLFDALRLIAQQYNDHLDLSVHRLIEYPADERSFRDMGFDGVLIIEESIYDHLSVWNNKNDTIDKVNYGYLEKITKLVLATTASLLDKDIPVQISIISPSENMIYLGERPIALPGFNIQSTPIRGLTYIFGSSTVTVNISTDEEIDLIYFLLDDRVMGVIRDPPYECSIRSHWQYDRFPLFGKHRIRVYVCTQNQHTAIDEMDIYLIKPF
ncbi:MAG: M28 family metallopeptidase [Candidatus Thermoplasmatota archaeon]|nr:M28 family metallopeptidase [Candidatus Thermoplasmatota archaeon]